MVRLRRSHLLWIIKCFHLVKKSLFPKWSAYTALSTNIKCTKNVRVNANMDKCHIIFELSITNVINQWYPIHFQIECTLSQIASDNNVWMSETTQKCTQNFLQKWHHTKLINIALSLGILHCILFFVVSIIIHIIHTNADVYYKICLQ